MKLESMRSEVRQRLGELTADFWTDAYIDSQLNAAQTRFCQEERWDWLTAIQTNVPLVAGNAEVELIDDVDATRHFAMLYTPDSASNEAQSVLLTKVSPVKGVELRISNPNRGTPGWYYVARVVDNEYAGPDYAVALMARVIPTPIENGTVEYIYARRPTTMTTGDEPIVPETYQDAVIAWATAQCWLKELNGGGKAQEQFNLYQSVLQQALRDQKNQGNDDILIWGGAQPQGRMLSPHAWVQSRIVPTLG